MVSAPFDKFVHGIERMRGYSFVEENDGWEVAFEPWSTEMGYPFSGPCIRIRFHRAGDRLVLERFAVEDEDGERPLNIAAARDALQAWMDSVSD